MHFIAVYLRRCAHCKRWYNGVQMWYFLSKIQCNAIIHGQLSPKFSQKKPHSSPMKGRYGVSLVNWNSVYLLPQLPLWNGCAVCSIMLYAIQHVSCFIACSRAQHQGWGQVKYLYLVLGANYRVLGTYLYLTFWNSKVLGTYLYLMAKVLDTCPSTQVLLSN